MKKLIITLIIITIISVIGYSLVMYGGHLSQGEGTRNIFLVIGELLMWPWLVLDSVQTYINPENKVLGFYSAWIFQYVGYLILFYLGYMLRNKMISGNSQS